MITKDRGLDAHAGKDPRQPRCGTKSFAIMAHGPARPLPGARPGPPLEPVHVDAEAAELRRTIRGHQVAAVALAEQAALEQRLGDRDADHAGQVVVAHPRPAQALRPGCVAEGADPDPGREQDEDLQRVGALTVRWPD
jgi:hypothetical protein